MDRRYELYSSLSFNGDSLVIVENAFLGVYYSCSVKVMSVFEVYRSGLIRDIADAIAISLNEKAVLLFEEELLKSADG